MQSAYEEASGRTLEGPGRFVGLADFRFQISDFSQISEHEQPRFQISDFRLQFA